MEQWRYATFCTELNPSVDFDEELRKILQDYGMKGWELGAGAAQNDTRYHLVFKTERPLYPNLDRQSNKRRGMWPKPYGRAHVLHKSRLAGYHCRSDWDVSLRQQTTCCSRLRRCHSHRGIL